MSPRPTVAPTAATCGGCLADQTESDKMRRVLVATMRLCSHCFGEQDDRRCRFGPCTDTGEARPTPVLLDCFDWHGADWRRPVSARADPERRPLLAVVPRPGLSDYLDRHFAR